MRKLLSSDWIGAISLPLTVILMEAFWLYPWLAWAGEWAMFTRHHPILSLLAVILLLTVAFFATRFLLNRQWPLRRVRFSIVAGGVTVIFIVIRSEYSAGFALTDGQWFTYTGGIFLSSFSRLHQVVMALMVAVYLWWRGASLGRSPLHVNHIYRSFAAGLFSLVLLTIIWGASLGTDSFQGLTSTFTLNIAGFFFFGLMALALSHLQSIRRKIPEKEEVARMLGRRWLYTMLGVVGGIFLVGIGITSLFSTEFVALLQRLLNMAYHLVLRALDYLFIAIGYVVEGLLFVAQLVMSWFRRGETPQPSAGENLTAIQGLPENITPGGFSSEVLLIMKWVVFAIISGVIIFFFIRAIFRYRPSQAGEEVEESHESLGGWEGLKSDLRLLLSRLRQRIKQRRRQKITAGAIPAWYGREDFDDGLSIREIYQRLLWEAAHSGIARHYHETPYEYARRFGRAVTDGNEPMNELTDLYINVRYGDTAAPDKQISLANNLGKVLHKLLGRTGNGKNSAMSS
ncbi:MAG: DUF4129 domain-containing protein [Dehalococcoidales bacterium]|nr:DUF4129 domain-containing protein [Dehalococcoidales bacterium]